MSAYAAGQAAVKVAKKKAGEVAANNAGSGINSAASRLRRGEKSAVGGVSSAFKYSGSGGGDDGGDEGSGEANNSEKGKSGGSFKKVGGILLIGTLLLLFIPLLLLYSVFNIGGLSSGLLVNNSMATDAILRKGGDIIPAALKSGTFPATTAGRLEDNGYSVGYENDGVFMRSNEGIAKVAYTGDTLGDEVRGELVVREDSTGKIISADEFYNEFINNVNLYNAVDLSTYSVAAYYYDEPAEQVFKALGTSRDDYNSNTDFKEVTSKLLGEGNNIDFDYTSEYYESVEIGKNDDLPASCSDTDEKASNDEKRVVICGGESESTVSGSNSTATALINGVKGNNKASSEKLATMNTADSLSIADGMSTEQRSMRFYVAVMQNLSKVKAGYGGINSRDSLILDAFATLGAINNNSGSNIDDVMNMLYETSTVEAVDVKTGEITEVTGSMLESPSLYSMLTNTSVNVSDVQNYSTERVLNTMENIANTSAGSETISGSVVSGSNKVSGKIWRFITGSQTSNTDFSVVEPTISDSLTNNSFDTIAGVSGGELLAQGAVNLGAELTLASGSSVGSEKAVKEQARMNDTVIALSAKADRLNRSPLDITSKNTFLGSIMYKFAMSSLKSNSILSKVASISRVTVSSFASLIPTTYADDLEPESNYMSAVGNCKHFDSIGAAGTAGCSRNEVFDNTTYNNFLSNEDYKAWREENIDCNGTVCTVKENSQMAEYINNNMKRKAQVGVLDEDILKKESENSGLGNRILDWFRGLSEENKRKASGAEYVNSGENYKYKYAQAYISTARALDAMRMYDGDSTAFNIEGFGLSNPVIAYINEHYPSETSIASND